MADEKCPTCFGRGGQHRPGCHADRLSPDERVLLGKLRQLTAEELQAWLEVFDESQRRHKARTPRQILEEGVRHLYLNAETAKWYPQDPIRDDPSACPTCGLIGTHRPGSPCQSWRPGDTGKRRRGKGSDLTFAEAVSHVREVGEQTARGYERKRDPERHASEGTIRKRHSWAKVATAAGLI